MKSFLHYFAGMALGLGLLIQSASAQTFPPFAELKPQNALPDPLTMLSGSKVETVREWETKRRPELQQLFQHYMYGKLPAAPQMVDAKTLFTNAKFLDGKATLRELSVRFSLPGVKANAPSWSKHTLHVLLITPNDRLTPAPAFVTMNFCGNHSIVADEQVKIPENWVYKSCKGVENDHATAAGRGSQADVWNVDLIIAKGYAFASFYSGDIDPDTADFGDGLAGEMKPDLQFAPDDPGAIACWAWGYHRVIDALEKQVAAKAANLNLKQVAAVGHSRNGKTTLLAAAMDPRIALAIPTQAGCGGTAPSRFLRGESDKQVESVKRINTSFPHWFCDEFTSFNDDPMRLPFDQNCLVAICAPRPVLFANAVEDGWANPDGQLEVLKAAAPVYALYGKRGIDANAKPEVDKVIGQELGYFIRPGKHSMNRQDWEAFLQFAEKHFAPN
ncbi:glucuronyl esterase domain-containing protein [Anatilimnocola floriformis]|uniref:glucuronyl esterase domain-containing protein n=1 Tax=Anatilimnocola floriformis TaxID=2948575 RepID=UPI0020C43842|nr:acetylxylan esterase [Anatilimnocola floriformis]